MRKPRGSTIRLHAKIPDTVNQCTRSYSLARSRLNLTLTRHIVTDFDVHGAEVIATLRREKPVDYLKLINAILTEADGEAAADTSYNVIERRIIRPGDPDC